MNIMRNSEESRQGLINLVNFIGKEGLTMLEIGSYLGESTAIFLKTGSFVKIHCLDFWSGGYDPKDYASSHMSGVESKFDYFAKNHPEKINKIKANSLEIPNLFDDDYFDFIYIDGDHSYEAVKRDIANCLPKLKKNGYIAGHDYGYSLFNVKQAVDETVGIPDGVFCDNSWVKKIL